ncbi:MAG: hypothetical protein ABIC04_02235 [Nanoarchaeota archaeon]
MKLLLFVTGFVIVGIDVLVPIRWVSVLCMLTVTGWFYYYSPIRRPAGMIIPLNVFLAGVVIWGTAFTFGWVTIDYLIGSPFSRITIACITFLFASYAPFPLFLRIKAAVITFVALNLILLIFFIDSHNDTVVFFLALLGTALTSVRSRLTVKDLHGFVNFGTPFIAIRVRTPDDQPIERWESLIPIQLLIIGDTKKISILSKRFKEVEVNETYPHINIETVSDKASLDGLKGYAFERVIILSDLGGADLNPFRQGNCREIDDPKITDVQELVNWIYGK